MVEKFINSTMQVFHGKHAPNKELDKKIKKLPHLQKYFKLSDSFYDFLQWLFTGIPAILS